MVGGGGEEIEERKTGIFWGRNHPASKKETDIVR